jgi:hypothetical protein
LLGGLTSEVVEVVLGLLNLGLEFIMLQLGAPFSLGTSKNWFISKEMIGLQFLLILVLSLDIEIGQELLMVLLWLVQLLILLLFKLLLDWLVLDLIKRVKVLLLRKDLRFLNRS